MLINGLIPNPIDVVNDIAGGAANLLEDATSWVGNLGTPLLLGAAGIAAIVLLK
jgi:hypothetical protein